MFARGAVPNSWSGATTIPILKRGKSPLIRDGYRPIQLLMIERKVAGRVLLNQLIPALAHDAHQFATAAMGGTSTPLFILSQHIKK
eukprot:5160464-Amphidinium_carterae.1